MATGKAHINGQMLEWARLEAGLSLAGAAHAAGIGDARGTTGEERIRSWESGEDFPTRCQLDTLAKAYVQPPIVFYLSTPPVEPNPLPDFRKLSPGEAVLSPNLKAFIAKMKARQQEVIDILTEERDEKLDPLPFVGRFSVETPIHEFVENLREALRVSFAEQRKIKDRDSLFRLLRSRAEDLGVYVIVQGDLGTHHSDIDPTEFRGFCLSDPIAPFVVLNDNDAKAALSFTLLHELSHLWINVSGISNISPYNERDGAAHIETFCNKVASRFLIPPDALSAEWKARKNIDHLQAIAEIAKEFSVSRRAITYRLRMADELTFVEWRQLDELYQREWKDKKARQKEIEGGPSHYTLKRYQLGGRLVKTVLGALDSGALGYSSASRILGVAAKGFSKIRPEAA